MMAGNSHNNGRSNGDECGRPPLRRSILRAMVQDFSPLWFTWVMNTGILGILTYQNPYQLPHRDLLAGLLLTLALALFALFSTLFLARLLTFRTTAYHELTSNLPELSFTACWCISFMTLTSLIALVVSPQTWAGRPFALLAYAMWWTVMAWNGATLAWVFTTLFRHHETSAAAPRIPAAIIIPAVSTATIAVTGGIVSIYADGLSARLVVPVIIVSFYWLGVGIFLGLLLYAFLFHDLLHKGFPPPDQTMSMFILVGPMGQSSAALLLLGQAAAASNRFVEYGGSGTFFTAEMAQALNGACGLFALLFDGLGCVFFLFSLAAVVDRAWSRQLRWNPTWNAIIFPNATLVTSFILFANEMDSPAYRVLSSGFTILLFLVYIVNAVFTVTRIAQGRLLVVREDWRVKQMMEEEEKER